MDLRRLEPASSRYAPPPLPFPVWGDVAKLIGYATAGLLALAVGLTAMNTGGWRDRLLGRLRPPQIRSLAVLPFANLSGDPNQDYFADGMTEALITDLGQIQALRVISRTSVMPFKATRKSLVDIARELHIGRVSMTKQSNNARRRWS